GRLLVVGGGWLAGFLRIGVDVVALGADRAARRGVLQGVARAAAAAAGEVLLAGRVVGGVPARGRPAAARLRGGCRCWSRGRGSGRTRCVVLDDGGGDVGCDVPRVIAGDEVLRHTRC